MIHLDRFDAMRILIAAVDGGSLSAASRSLGMPLPTVSRRVSQLEATLGAQLVVRTSRRLQLTDAGVAFIAAARRILDDVLDAEQAASGEYSAPRGDLLVTASIMFGKLHVTPVVLAFLEAYPEVKVRVVLADHVVDLTENHIDVAIRIGSLPDSGLVAIRLGEIRWVTCASPDYLARKGLPRTPADLEAHDCLAFEGLQTARTWSFADSGGQTSVNIRPRFSINTADAVIDAAVAGVGVARLTSYQTAQALRDGRLTRVLWDYSPAPVPVHLVHTGPPMLPLKLRAFLDFATPRLRTDLSRIGAECAG